MSLYKKLNLLFLEMVENIHSNEKWFYSGENVEIVDQFVYLGLIFNFNGKFFVTPKQLAAQGRKATSNIVYNETTLSESLYFTIPF